MNEQESRVNFERSSIIHRVGIDEEFTDKAAILEMLGGHFEFFRTWRSVSSSTQHVHFVSCLVHPAWDRLGAVE